MEEVEEQRFVGKTRHPLVAVTVRQLLLGDSSKVAAEVRATVVSPLGTYFAKECSLLKVPVTPLERISKQNTRRSPLRMCQPR